MIGELYYSDRESINFDLDGFFPASEINPYYSEGLKILLDCPDLVNEYEQKRVIQAELEQNFSRRIYQRIINEQRRTNREAEYTHRDAQLSQLVLDYKRPEVSNEKYWEFTGTDNADVANDPFNPAVIDTENWRWTTRSPEYTDNRFVSSPTSVRASYSSSADAQMSINVTENSESFYLEWHTSKVGVNDEAKMLVYSSSDHSEPIAEIYWNNYGSGWRLAFQGWFYDGLIVSPGFYKYRLELNVAAKTVTLYFDDALVDTRPMLNSGTTDGIARVVSMWFDNSADGIYHDDLKYPGLYSVENNVRMSGNAINLAEVSGLGLKRFWDMTTPDFSIVEDIGNGDNFCLVEHKNLHKIFQGHERLYILLDNNRLIGREILSITEENPTTERIVVKTIFNEAISSSEIKRSGFARLCRLGDNEVEMEFITATHYSAKLQIVELASEEYGDFDT